MTSSDNLTTAQSSTQQESRKREFVRPKLVKHKPLVKITMASAEAAFSEGTQSFFG